jgi:alpha-tubulin suppressor-like RCC1 family protein
VTGAIAIAAGEFHTCVLISDGTARCWGSNYYGQAGNGTTAGSTSPVVVSGLTGAFAISAGQVHTCALISDGTAKCWGVNGNGALGNGSLVDSTTPVAVTAGSDLPGTGATEIVAGVSRTCALVSDGTAKCWGINSLGQLGNGTTSNSPTPVVVSGLTGATTIANGNAHTCALISDGTARCWGANTYGRLGDGTTTSSTTPVVVSGLSGAIAVAAGTYHTCALISDGTARCWGYNGDGELGNGTWTDSTTPVVVSGLTGAIAIAAGDQHTCGLMSDGTAKCWGINVKGQLGNGTMTGSNTPVAVSGLTGAIAIAAEALHTCALMSDGTAKCWGWNSNGQLGNGTMTDSTTPGMVSGLTGAIAIAAGSFHTCSLMSDGTAKCWGANSNGQLGNGTMTDSSTPVVVSGLFGATTITGGGQHTCALILDGTARCWGYNGITSSTTPVATVPLVNRLAWSSSSVSVATIDSTSGLATAIATGNTTIAATYGGLSADSALTVSKLNQTITFTTLAPSTAAYNSTFPVAATSDSGLAVTLTVDAATNGVCSISSGIVTMLRGAGTCTIDANQAGNGNYNPASQKQTSATATKANTNTVLTSSPSPATYGQSITFAATVSASTATGIVTFQDGGVTLGTGSLSGGVATFTTSTLSAGAHSITASYTGDANYNGSASGVLSQTVNKISTNTVLTSSLNPAVYGQSVTFTATVSPSTATGIITFQDGGVTLGAGSLSGGIVTFATSALSVGAHSITASYAGDVIDNGSASAILPQTVNGAPTITVININDSGWGSLRDAIANIAAGGTINFSLAYPATIVLTSGPLVINTSSTISGPGTTNLAISGNNAYQVMSIGSGTTINISGVTINNGSAPSGNGGGISNAGTLTLNNAIVSGNSALYYGGGIYNSGMLVLNTSQVSGNTVTNTVSGSPGRGGGIANFGTLTVNNSAVSGNSAAMGGALYNCPYSCTLMLTNSTVSTNSAYGGGGGILSDPGGTMTVTGSTFFANSSSGHLGGAVYNYGGTLNLTNSTFYGNSAQRGGAIRNDLGPLTLTNVTVVGNTGTISVGGIFNNGGAASIKNSILANNVVTNGGSFNCYSSGGSASSGGYNLSDDTTCAGFFTAAGDLNNTPARLDPAGLQNNGGPTPTIALVVASPAVDAIPLSACTDTNGNPVSTDQRGIARPQGSACDIGALERVGVNTSLALTSSLNPSTSGQSITFMATVSPSAATGIVMFQDGGVTLGTGSLSGGVATFTTSTLAVGVHSISASYAGDVTYNGSASGILSQTVNKISTNTVLASSPNPAVYGQSVTLTATVSPSAATGNVTFQDGGVTLGAGTLSGGVATFTTSTLTTGAHSITASYAGDANYNGSASSVLSQTVNKMSTNTVVTSSLNPALYGQSVTLTATVSPSAATGTVTFQDGGVTLGTGSLSGGVATFTTSTLTTGAHSITASYAGDAIYNGSTSSVVSQTVNKISTNTVLTSSLNPSVYGQSVTLTATVSPSAATGTVTFQDGGVTLGTGSLSGGVATFTTSTLSTGAHSITASYGGDAIDNSSASSVLSQAVNKASTSTVLSSSLNPSVYGQMVTLTSTVSSAAGLPIGNVSFYDGGTLINSVALNANGQATLSASLGAGAHNLTAAYGGSGNFAVSNSATVVESVGIASTATSLTSSPNPSIQGQAVNFVATVTGQFGGPVAGTVTFTEGANKLLGTASVVNGSATLLLSSLGVGSHTVTAVYGGDVNDTGSTSSATTQNVVAPTATSTTISSSLNPSTVTQVVTFTAVVTSSSAGTPTGIVTFVMNVGKSGNTVLGTVTLSGGQATFSAGSLPAGSLGITATYSGDMQFGSSNSALTQVVNLATTASVLSSTPNPSNVGQAVTFSVIVSCSTGIVPTGTVSFKQGNATLGTSTLNASGSASFSTSTLSGHSNIRAVYNGDANCSQSTSNSVQQVVQ